MFELYGHAYVLKKNTEIHEREMREEVEKTFLRFIENEIKEKLEKMQDWDISSGCSYNYSPDFDDYPFKLFCSVISNLGFKIEPELFYGDIFEISIPNYTKGIGLTKADSLLYNFKEEYKRRVKKFAYDVSREIEAKIKADKLPIRYSEKLGKCVAFMPIKFQNPEYKDALRECIPNGIQIYFLKDENLIEIIA